MSCLLLLGGCSHTVRVSGVEDVRERQTEWESAGLWGNLGEADVDVAKLCGPGRVAGAMGVEHTAGTVIVNVLTLGFYSPHVAFVECGRPAASEVAL